MQKQNKTPKKPNYKKQKTKNTHTHTKSPKKPNRQKTTHKNEQKICQKNHQPQPYLQTHTPEWHFNKTVMLLLLQLTKLLCCCKTLPRELWKRYRQMTQRPIEFTTTTGLRKLDLWKKGLFAQFSKEKPKIKGEREKAFTYANSWCKEYRNHYPAWVIIVGQELSGLTSTKTET